MRFKRILVWEVNWIGDVIFSSAFLRAIRKRFPDAYIACITVQSCKEVLEVNPNINEVIIYDEKLVHKGLLKKLKIIIDLRRKRFDAVFLLHRSLTRTLICLMGGIRKRIGYAYKKRNVFLTHKLKTTDKAHHRIEYFLGLARKMGADTEYQGIEFYVTDEDEAQAGQILNSNLVNDSDRLIAVNPGGNWAPKRWPARKYAELCDRLIQELKVKVIITGAEKDVDLYLNIQEQMHEKAISVCGRTTLRQLGCVFKRSELLISADSGPLHIALAMKRKVIALFGPTSPEITGPYAGADCVVLQKDIGCVIPCYEVDCVTNRCMDAISVDEVFDQAKKMLGSSVG